jgi:hypothetical protein
METRAVIKLFFLQGKTRMEIHAILTETLVCFLHGRAKDLSAPFKNITLNITGFEISVFAVVEGNEENVSNHTILLCTVRKGHVKRVTFTLL